MTPPLETAPAPYQLPVSQPLGGPLVTGTQVTVDMMLNPVTRVLDLVRDLVAANEGYFAEDIFATPGFTVQGGAILYQPLSPVDHFLDPNQTIAPRAPGAEAPRVGALRKAPRVARPESWAGSIEVTDEARRRNDVLTIQTLFRRVANTFADTIQRRAVETLNAFVAASGRAIPGTNWHQARTSGIGFVDPNTLPQKDFGLVISQFVTDRLGIRPDRVIVNENDAFQLDSLYGDKLEPLLARYNLTLLASPHQASGTAIFLKSKQVGVIAFEKPLDTEYTREGERKTDVYVNEATPVFVCNDEASVLAITGIGPTGLI